MSSRHTEIIDGHKCEFEIFEDSKQFFGVVNILHPCLLNPRLNEQNLHPTEGEIIEKLREKAKNYIQQSNYNHPPSVDGGSSLVGSICSRCGQKVIANDFSLGRVDD